ncbi:hypothetical protein GCM10009119_43190 [Algoriphagus jejuensis]|uniref:Dolichyl-phosphate-mannose-protein mannosyltransferase n=1 Tax=Algoriphagus jejuensis TaxID=419934 RepID=A0ABN1N624_9BACT
MLLRLVNLFLIAIIALFSASSGVLFFLTTTYFVGIITAIFLSDRDQADKTNLLFLFDLAFLVYNLFVFVAYYSFIEADNSFFKYSDQYVFYEIAEQLGRNSSLKQIYHDCFVYRLHIEQEGAYFLFGTIAYLSNNFFDGNSILIQSISVSFFAILINLFVYKIISHHTTKFIALRYAVLYLVFSHILAYSPWLLRDVHIALLFAIAIYILHLEFSYISLVLLLCLNLFTFEFRFEHGLVFTFFPLFYIVNNSIQSKYKEIYVSILILFLLVVGINYYSLIISNFSKVSNSLDNYTEFTEESVSSSDGLGAIIYRLPSGVSHIARVVFSQISPFPPWVEIQKSTTLSQSIIGLVTGISSLFWSFVFFINVKYFRYSRYMSSHTKYLLIFAVVFLFLNSSNISERRIMAIYPLLYVFFIFVTSRLSKDHISTNIFQFFRLYSSLLLVYFLFKFL